MKIDNRIHHDMIFWAVMQNIEINAQYLVAFPRQFSAFVAILCKQGPYFREQGDASKCKLLLCSVSVKINLHTKIEKKILTKTWFKPFPSLATALFFLIGVKRVLENVYFEISVKMCMLWLSRYFCYSMMAIWVESTGMGGDALTVRSRKLLTGLLC